MIKDNQKYFNRLQVIIDAFVIAASYLGAWILRFSFVSPFSEGAVRSLPFEIYLYALVLIIPLYLILYQAFRLYTPKRVQSRRVEAADIFKANVLGLLLLIGFLFLASKRLQDFSRGMLFIFLGINVVAEAIVRNFIRFILRRIRSSGMNQKHIILVGNSQSAKEYIDRIQHNPQWGYTVQGLLDDELKSDEMIMGVPVIGRIGDLEALLAQNQLDEIAITLKLSEYAKLQGIVSVCEKSGVHTKFVPDYNNIIPTSPYTEDILGLPVINIRYVPLSNTFHFALKRVIDIVGSLFALALASPVMLVIVILMKITTPGPLIYKQERVGLHNKPFCMYKFRSMRVQPEQEEKKAWTKKNDDRITKLGKFMRRTSIDELPQLFNILKGDMSLVGPRPERPFFVEKFREEIPRYMVKHQVRPGLTGWAQVNGYRGDTSIRKRIDCDLYYIENWTVGFDFKILFLTVFKGFVNKNAY
ncbi:MAG: undecaprenyl-phosphate glucose phosphotransferase [Lachnospiraceae bacterium]